MAQIGQSLVALAAVMAVACSTDPRNDTIGAADGNRTDVTASNGASAVSDGDRDFVRESMIASMAEVELGRLAETRASNAEVKQFAQMMVQDHSKTADSLKQIAQQYSIPMPGGLDEKHQELRTRLSGLRGADFDREYLSAMVDGHEDVMDHLESRADVDQFGSDRGTIRPEGADTPLESSINQWAATTLPAVRHHLEEARRIQDSLGNNRAAR